MKCFLFIFFFCSPLFVSVGERERRYVIYITKKQKTGKRTYRLLCVFATHLGVVSTCGATTTWRKQQDDNTCKRGKKNACCSLKERRNRNVWRLRARALYELKSSPKALSMSYLRCLASGVLPFMGGNRDGCLNEAASCCCCLTSFLYIYIILRWNWSSWAIFSLALGGCSVVLLASACLHLLVLTCWTTIHHLWTPRTFWLVMAGNTCVGFEEATFFLLTESLGTLWRLSRWIRHHAICSEWHPVFEGWLPRMCSLSYRVRLYTKCKPSRAILKGPHFPLNTGMRLFNSVVALRQWMPSAWISYVRRHISAVRLNVGS